MEKDRPSSTAEGVAIQRALHQTLDEDPKILDDPVAVRLLDPASDGYKTWLALLEGMPAPRRLRSRGYFVMRSRYTEDCLAESLSRGVRQYVILGAGLDSFGYRQPSWARPLRVFEVDHPATQRWKRSRLAAAKVSIPDNVTFAPIDFEKVSLKKGLAASGLDFGIPTFFSWLGVTPYLTEDALDGTLKFVLSMPPSSEVVLDFSLPDRALPPDEQAFRASLAARTAEMGEPFLTHFVAEELTAKLEAMGFSKVAHLSPQAAHERYFAGRRDGLDSSAGAWLMQAIV